MTKVSTDPLFAHPDRQPDEIFVHSRRPQWGLGLLVDRDADSVILKFQDGKSRRIKAGFFHLLRKPDLKEALRSVERDSSSPQAEAVARIADADITPRAASAFAQQTERFLAAYPDGFQDPKYRAKYRTPAAGSRSKLPVDPLLALAADKLNGERKGFSTAYLDVLSILGATSLIPSASAARPIKSIPPSRRAAFGAILRKLLHGAYDYDTRFHDWLEKLKEWGLTRVPWPLATFLPAIVHPQEQVFVRPVILQKQGLLLQKGDRFFKVPSSHGYAWFLDVANATRFHLREAGLAPADMFDAYFFSWETLRTAGRKRE